jgi:hypothetical protein
MTATRRAKTRRVFCERGDDHGLHYFWFCVCVHCAAVPLDRIETAGRQMTVKQNLLSVLVSVLAVIVLAALSIVTLCYIYDDCASPGPMHNIETRFDPSRK